MEFYNILLNAHKGFAYLELLLVALFLVALLMTMFGYSGKVNNFLKKTTLFTMIFFHIQLLKYLLFVYHILKLYSVANHRMLKPGNLQMFLSVLLILELSFLFLPK